MMNGISFFKNPPNGGRPPRERRNMENNSVVGSMRLVFFNFARDKRLFLWHSKNILVFFIM